MSLSTRAGGSRSTVARGEGGRDPGRAPWRVSAPRAARRQMGALAGGVGAFDKRKAASLEWRGG